MAVEIVPSVLAATLPTYRRRLRLAERLATHVHLDIMDGRFVPTKSISPAMLAKLKPMHRPDVHLMVEDPLRWLSAVLAVHPRRIIVHAELGQRLRPLLAVFRSHHLPVVIAVNPRTSLTGLRQWASLTQGFQIMSVTPGQYGAPFQPSAIKRVAWLKKHYPRKAIVVDGGMTPATAGFVAAAGASTIVVGSHVQFAKQPQLAWNEVRRSVRAARP